MRFLTSDIFRKITQVLRDNLSALLLAISLLLNVLLLLQVKEARAALDQNRLLAAGERVPELGAVTMRGAPYTFRYETARQGTVLYYFDPHCNWCKRNAGNVEALIRQIKDRYSVVGYTASTMDLQGFLAATKLPAPIIVTDGDKNIRQLLKLQGTPQTLVVNREGTVVKNWQGAYTGRTQKDIEQFFGVTLPGITAGQDQTQVASRD